MSGVHAGSTFVGRDTEIARLTALIDDRASTLVLVTGEAGIGKTSLVAAAVARRRESGQPVLLGVADPAGGDRFGLWRNVARRLDVPLPDTDPSVPTSRQVDELADLLEAAMLDERADLSTLVVLEDLHWADASSVALLTALLPRLLGSAVSVVATVRSGAVDAEWLADVSRSAVLVALQGWTVAQVDEFARLATGSPAGPDVSLDLVQRTGGNPLLVRELLANPSSRSALADAILDQSIEALGGPCAAALSVLALAGPEAPPTVVAAALDLPIDEMGGVLLPAVAAAIVVDDGRWVWFRHALLADAAARRVPSSDLGPLHLRLAVAWDDAGSDASHRLRAARHRLAAVPAITAGDAAAAALLVVERLRAERRPGDAIDLARQALGLDLAGAAPTLRAELLLALAEAQWETGDELDAIVTYEDAAVAATAGDVELRVRCEVGRQRHHNPFMPDPETRAVLAELDDRLDRDDSALRVKLLGRRAVVALQPPAEPATAERLATEAVAMARRLGDPEALLDALDARRFSVTSPDGLRERGAEADEVIELARRAGRSERALPGYEWRLAARYAAGDLDGAWRALDELEALASVASSPWWRYSVALRRIGLLAHAGDLDGAVEGIDRATELGRPFTNEMELVGLDIGSRTSTSHLFGRLDPGLAEGAEQMAAWFASIPSPFVQVRMALTDLLVHGAGAARRRITPWWGRPEVADDGPEPRATLGILATLAWELDEPAVAEAIRERLEPYSGLIGVDNAVGVQLPVDHQLALLALLTGDDDAAEAFAQAALASGRSAGSPLIEAHALHLLAEVQRRLGRHDAAGAAQDAADARAESMGLRLRLRWDAPDNAGGPAVTPVTTGARSVGLWPDDDGWTFVVDGSAYHLTPMSGLGHLHKLLSRPGVPIAATDLAGVGQGVPLQHGLGPGLDARSKREYRQRIRDLEAEMDDADRDADPERSSRARLELDALMDELRRAVGLSGRDRPQGDSGERARVNVTRNLRRAIAVVDKRSALVGGHLANVIRTGHQCEYRPDPSSQVRWVLRRPEG